MQAQTAQKGGKPTDPSVWGKYVHQEALDVLNNIHADDKEFLNPINRAILRNAARDFKTGTDSVGSLLLRLF